MSIYINCSRLTYQKMQDMRQKLKEHGYESDFGHLLVNVFYFQNKPIDDINYHLNKIKEIFPELSDKISLDNPKQLSFRF